MTDLERITARVWRNGDPNLPDTVTPALTLYEFFVGNDVVGSIGCNLEGSPHPSEIWRVLKEIEREISGTRPFSVPQDMRVVGVWWD